MFILSSISSGSEFWSVNHTSIHEKSRLLVFKNTNVLGEISINWTNGVMEQMEQMYTRLLNFVNNHCNIIDNTVGNIAMN